MDTVRSLADGTKSYVSEQVAALKAFNKREALLQGVNLGEHVFSGLCHIAKSLLSTPWWRRAIHQLGPWPLQA
jgi:hypothetical protein